MENIPDKINKRIVNTSDLLGVFTLIIEGEYESMNNAMILFKNLIPTIAVPPFSKNNNSIHVIF